MSALVEIQGMVFEAEYVDVNLRWRVHDHGDIAPATARRMRAVLAGVFPATWHPGPDAGYTPDFEAAAVNAAAELFGGTVLEIPDPAPDDLIY